MITRAEAKRFAELSSIAVLVFVLYLLTFGGGSGGTEFTHISRLSPKWSSMNQTSLNTSAGNSAPVLLACSPPPDKHLSPAAQTSDFNYIHMIPRPKIVSRPENEPALPSRGPPVLAFGEAVSLTVRFEARHADARSEDTAFLLDRLCAQSHTFQSSSAEREIINGSSIDYIYKVDAIVMSSAQFVTDSALDIPADAVAEAYSLDVTSGSVLIRTPSIAGLRHALSSVAQLLENPSPLQLPLRVVDWPTQRWRGLMLDTARHFLPVRRLLRALDAMHAVKMNYLHLHLTDSQSFPVLLEDEEGLPLSQLARRGAHRPAEVYTLQELGSVVAYAGRLGINVVPEIDVPAHTKAWGLGFPEIVVSCPKAESRGDGASKTDIPSLDISSPRTIAVVGGILRQLARVFPSEYMHVGGDEVHTDCWDESEPMQALKKEKNSNWVQLLKDFETSIFDIVEGLGKTPIVWQGIQDINAIPSANASRADPGQVVVQPWKCWGGLSGSAARTAAAAGREVIVSACMYLDWDIEWGALLSADTVSTAMAMAKPLPLRSNGPSRRKLSQSEEPLLYTVLGPKPSRWLQSDASGSAQRSAVLGGEAPLWTEKVDFSNMECRLWPRAAASAALFWGFAVSPSGEEQYALSLKGTNRFPSLYERERGDNVTIYEKYYSTLRGQLRWLESYEFVQDFLENIIRVNPATVTVHADRSARCRAPLPAASGLEPFQYGDAGALFADISAEISCAEARKIEYSLPVVTSQCEMLPAHLRTPLVAAPASPDSVNNIFGNRLRGSSSGGSTPSNTVNIDVKVTSFNIENGGFEGNRIDKIQEWLLSRALYGDLMIGLLELNKWQSLRDTQKGKLNLKDIVFRAAEAGYTYSHVISSAEHPYSIGLVSVLPFRVVAEYGPPHLLRLLLHVYFETLDLHVVVVHLTPRSSIARRDEALFVQRVLRPWIDAGARMVLMGDFNTLTPAEQCTLYNTDCGNDGGGSINDTITSFIDVIQRNRHPAYARFREKYCSYTSSNKLEIDYTPFQTLLNTSFVETCDLMCRQSTANAQWKELSSEQYTSCLLKFCGHSEPTLYNPEWPLAAIGVPAPKLKVDNILISKTLADSVKSLSVSRNGAVTTRPYNVSASVLRGDDTDTLSDHYPVHVEFPLPCPTRYWRRH